MDFACKTFDIKEVIKCSLKLTRKEVEILDFLLAHAERDFSTSDIADDMKIDITTAQKSVKKLYSKGVLIRSQVNLEGGGYEFRYKMAPKIKIRKLVKDLVSNWAKRFEDEIDKW